MRKEITILVLGLFSCRWAFEKIVRTLTSVPSYKVSPVPVGDAELLTQWTKVLQDFNALVLIGVEGSEEILQSLEAYKGPVVAATVDPEVFYQKCDYPERWKTTQQEFPRKLVGMNIGGFVEGIKKVLQDTFSELPGHRIDRSARN